LEYASRCAERIASTALTSFRIVPVPLKSRIGTWLVIDVSAAVLSCGIPAAEAVVPRAVKVIGIIIANAMIPARCNLFAAMANEDTIPPKKLVLNATGQILLSAKTTAAFAEIE
jgi:hypothetical protein